METFMLLFLGVLSAASGGFFVWAGLMLILAAFG